MRDLSEFPDIAEFKNAIRSYSDMLNRLSNEMMTIKKIATA
jgi:hypothetical protein